MNLKETQKKIDLIKYEDSEKAKKDLCGTYLFCKNCNKKNKYPCAAALRKTEVIEERRAKQC